MVEYAGLNPDEWIHLGPSRRSNGFGFFDQGFLANDDDDAGRGDVEAALVGLKVIADFGVLGKTDVAVDDGAADARVAADVDVIVDDRGGDFAVAVDADVVAEDRGLHAAAGEDGAVTDDGVKSDTHAVGIGKDKLRRGILLLPGAQRPGLVVEVEDRRNADEVHVGFVVGVESAHVAPVEGFFGVFVDEVIGEDAMLGDDARDDVLAEVVGGLGILRIGEERGDQELGIEDVDTHRGVAVARLVRRGLGFVGFLFEADDAPVLVGFNDTKLTGRFGRGNFDGGDGDFGAGIDMLLEHFG